MQSFNELDTLRAIIKNSPDQIFVASASGVILHVYKGTDRSYHLDYDSMVGKHFTELYSPEFSTRIQTILTSVLKDGFPHFVTYPIKVADMYSYPRPENPDNIYWFEARIIPATLADHNEPIVLWWARDITKNVKLEQAVKKLIDFDELTGVYNRRKFLGSLAENFSLFKRYQNNTCIIMLDIDDFKKVNDTFGHQCGDEVIKQVAQLFSSSVRESDSLGRIGGEEFSVILPNTNIAHAVLLAERLLQNVATKCCQISEHRSIDMTVSIGISEFYPSDNDEALALNRADQAMYVSKRNGKNRVTVFEQSLGCSH